MIILGVAISYNIFYIPYSIAFGVEALNDPTLGTLDVISVIIYILDMIIHANTAIKLGYLYFLSIYQDF